MQSIIIRQNRYNSLFIVNIHLTGLLTVVPPTHYYYYYYYLFFFFNKEKFPPSPTKIARCITQLLYKRFMLDDDFLTLVIRARARVGRDRDASRRNAWTHARFTRADLHARENSSETTSATSAGCVNASLKPRGNERAAVTVRLSVAVSRVGGYVA